MIISEKTISSKAIYNGKVLKFHVDTVELENGHISTRELVDHPGGVGVVAIDGDGYVCMVTQYRKPYEKAVTEIPAGKLDPRETPEVCGKRELKEETGLVCESLVSLGELYPSAGYTNEIIHLYLATDFVQGEANPDDDEFVDVEKIHIDTLCDMIMSGEIKDGKTIAAILKTKLYLDK